MSAVEGLEDNLSGVIEAAQTAWRGLVAARPELADDPPPKREAPRGRQQADKLQKIASQPLDVPTALAWYDQVNRFYAANPRSATAIEIQNIFDAHKGRYLPTKAPPPLPQMVALRISALQWQDVFHQACKIKDREQRLGRGDESPPPINLILSLAENQVKLRVSIESKRKRLAAIRQSARQEPT